MTGWLLVLLLGLGCEGSSLGVCSRKWVKMNDRNYQKALEHYSDCAAIGHRLEPSPRARYQDSLIGNINKTCHYFFDRSELPISSLIGVLREVSRILENLDQNTISLPRRQRVRGDGGSCKSIQEIDCSPGHSSDGRILSFTRGKRTKLILWGLFWILVFTVIVQLLFILWLFCVSACLGLTTFGVGDSRVANIQKDGEILRLQKNKLDFSSGARRARKSRNINDGVKASGGGDRVCRTSCESAIKCSSLQTTANPYVRFKNMLNQALRPQEH